MVAMEKNKIKAAFISSYLPRKCGIATFTSDLIRNMNLAGGENLDLEVIAMQSDNTPQYHNPVKFRIRRDDKYDYVFAADYINSSDIDIVSVQHEFGLFGGQAGSYINLLLEKLRKPVITTVHTVLEKPSAEYLSSLTNVCSASERIIVMNRRGIQMLHDTYDVPRWKIELMPHGIPDLPFTHNGHYKRILGMAGRRTILTFGLLSENKGIEMMLRAMPAIVKADPSVLYIVLGTTHPEVLRNEGLSYKLKLEKIVEELSLQNNVLFYDRFVEDEELFNFLGAADIYVTPYLNEEQLTSGTLAFAVGTGKAVVSTPYWAAQELLVDGRGKLVRFGDPEHLAQSIIEILGNDSIFNEMKRKAYEYGRSMTWPKVGQSYWELFRSEVRYVSTWKPSADSSDSMEPIYGQRPMYQPV
jgi:glycosyltransferase involved in cell wall biosynthesis